MLQSRAGSVEEIKLNRVKICGFKSIKDCSVDLHDINILIGPNGSGKSNFISALCLLQKVLDKNLQETVGKTGLPAMLYGGVKTTQDIEMEFSFNFNSYGFELTTNDAGNLVFRKEYYGWGEGHWEVPRTPYGYESEYELGVKNNINSYVKPVLEAKKWRVYHFHDTTSTAGMKQVGMISDTISLHHDASNLAPFLYMLKQAYPDSYEDILQTVRLVAPYFSDFVLEPNAENKELIRLRWKQKGMDATFGIDQLSDGTLRLICLAVLLLQPSELQPSTIILDEPELGLHPFAIQLLAELIHEASAKKQLIISTQSAELLDNFSADNVIVTEMTEKGSVYTRLSQDKLKDWLEEYSISAIWKKNIFGGQP